MKADFRILFKDYEYNENEFSTYEKMLSYYSEHETFDYIEKRLAGLDYLYDHINLEILNRVISDYFKIRIVDDLGVIYDEINTQPTGEPAPIDLSDKIKMSVDKTVGNNDSQDDIINDTITYIVDIVNKGIDDVEKDLKEHIDNADISEAEIREFIDKINIDINKITIILKRLSDKCDNIENTNTNIQNRVEILELMINDLQNDNNRLKQSNNELSKEVGRLKGDINNINYNLSLVNKDNVKLKENIKQLNENIDKLNKEKGIDASEYNKTLKLYKDKLNEYDKSNKELYNLLVKYKQANENLAKNNSSLVHKINISNANNRRQNNCCRDLYDDGLSNWTRSVMYGKCC